MDFGWTESQRRLRKEVRAFIKENVTQDVLDEMDQSIHKYEEKQGRQTGKPGELLLELRRLIGERGWLGYSYPTEYGGGGGDMIGQNIIEEEFLRAGINVSLAGSGAPAIMAAGTEEQKRHYLPKLINLEYYFALGFTEPHAGADLAALRCRAVRDGDEFVINGQKMYTTSAHVATHMYLMARTDPDARRHDGISIFLFPMDTPGITVRALWTIQNSPRAPRGTCYGEARSNETFFDNVRIHESCLLGKENHGWRVGAMGLNLDRVGAARYLRSVLRDEDIVNFLKTASFDEYTPREDAAIRDKVAEMWIEAQVCRLMTLRSMSIVKRDGEFTYEGAAEKVWSPEHGVRVTEAITQMLGPYGSLLNGSEDAIMSGVFAHNVMGAFQSGINHGSVQIMRDQVAKRGFGMPSANRFAKK